MKAVGDATAQRPAGRFDRRVQPLRIMHNRSENTESDWISSLNPLRKEKTRSPEAFFIKDNIRTGRSGGQAFLTTAITISGPRAFDSMPATALAFAFKRAKAEI
jgi:hypothetical protein